MKSKAFFYIYFALATVLVFMVSLAFLFPGQDFRIAIESPDSLDSAWQVSVPDPGMTHDPDLNTEPFIIDLPTALTVPGSTTIVLQRTLDEQFNEVQGLLLRGALQSITASVNDELIYDRSFTADNNQPFNPPVSSWHIIQTPADSAGKTLSITYHSPYQGMSGQINEIKSGQLHHLKLYLLFYYGPGFLITALIFFVGVMLTISPLIFKRKEYSETSAVGLFTLLVSIYLLGEGRMLEFITGNQFILGSLSYVTLAILPTPLLIFMKEISTTKFGKIFHGLTIVLFANLLLIFLLQLTGVRAFFESLWMTHIWLSVSAVISVMIMVFETYHKKNKDAAMLLHGLCLMVLFGFIELYYFYRIDPGQVSFFMRTGVILFAGILTFNAVKRISELHRKSLQADLYEKLAYADPLTKSPNRMAFDRDLHMLLRDQVDHEITVGIFDLNNLKFINDTYGHKYGDAAIIATYETLQDVYGKHGICYRIGGDEFACIIRDLDQAAVSQLAEALNKQTTERDKSLFYPFVIAQGFAAIHPENSVTVDALKHQADKNMYLDKQRKKAQLASGLKTLPPTETH